MILLNDDCLNALKKMESESVDSLVTDPPAGISFMNKEWDSDKGGRDGWIAWMTEVMRECHRVLKPGAHGLVWAIPRTSHWTATALENSGFEVRDVVTHLFGSGFPKSLDISKAIDKAAGAEREIVVTIKKTPSASKCHEGWERPWAKDKTTMDITAPFTDSAKKWQGWGTALKPASEHWILVRKPLSEKTVASNVLKHGTGGINIDASRIATDELKGKVYNNNNVGWACNSPPSTVYGNEQGRFPANLVLSHSPHCQDDQCDIECSIMMLDAQGSGYGRSAGGSDTKAKNNSTNMFGNNATAIMGVNNYNDKGGVSRFFYCAKISTSERNAGAENNHPTVKPKKLMSYFCKMITPPKGIVLDPFMGSGSTGIAAKECGFEFIGIEREKDYFEIASKRINGS